MIKNILKKWLKGDREKQYQLGRESGYLDGIKVGVAQYKGEQEALIERKATNMFCEQGYPNPLHVYDISPSGMPYLAQEPITKERVKQLKSEVGLLKSMQIYEIIQETIKQEAIKKAVIFSTKWEETLAGKMMLANLGIIKRILDTIQSADMDKIPEASGSISQNML